MPLATASYFPQYEVLCWFSPQSKGKKKDPGTAESGTFQVSFPLTHNPPGFWGGGGRAGQPEFGCRVQPFTSPSPPQRPKRRGPHSAVPAPARRQRPTSPSWGRACGSSARTPPPARPGTRGCPARPGPHQRRGCCSPCPPRGRPSGCPQPRPAAGGGGVEWMPRAFACGTVRRGCSG